MLFTALLTSTMAGCLYLNVQSDKRHRAWVFIPEEGS